MALSRPYFVIKWAKRSAIMDTDGKISKSRLDDIRETIEATGMDICYLHFTTYEIELIIDQTPMKDSTKEICRLRFLKEMTIDEIADKVQVDRKTVLARLKKASPRLKCTAMRIFK